MGYPFECHEQAQALVGFQNDRREQKAHIIIRKENVGAASNDVGFVRKDGKFELLISDYDRRNKKTKENLLERLPQEYGLIKFKKQAQLLGLNFVSQKKVDGRIQIKLMAP